MKKTILLFLPFLLFVAGTFVACEEVQEVGKYDNWQERNRAFVDSIKHETGDVHVTSLDQLKEIPVGQLFAIQTTTGTNLQNQYVYCKKLLSNTTGKRPLYTDVATVYYYGTYLTGDSFDGCFQGYGALDRVIPATLDKKPTEFDTTATFGVANVIPGWTAVLQYMRVGERWMLYIPWQSAYGTEDYSPPGGRTILGYSALTFDLMLNSVE